MRLFNSLQKIKPTDCSLLTPQILHKLKWEEKELFYESYFQFLAALLAYRRRVTH